MNYGEADRILTVFTERLGKVKALARGVRKITSKLAGNLEPYNLLELELHEGKTFYSIIGAEIIEAYGADETLSKSSHVVYLAEIIDKIFEENEKNIAIFELLVEMMRKIQKGENGLIIRSFELQILQSAGFQPNFYQCGKCRVDLKEGELYLDPLTGEILCISCGGSDIHKIDDATLKLLRLMQERGLDICDKIKCDLTAKQQAEKILEQYLENALERELKSKKYLKY